MSKEAKIDHMECEDTGSGFESVVYERRACLSVIKGELAGEIYKLHNDITIIGRGTEADLVFSYTSMSRQHVMVIKRRDEYFISDLASTNGVQINRETVIHPKVLREGDKIGIGDMIFKFSLEDMDDTAY